MTQHPRLTGEGARHQSLLGCLLDVNVIQGLAPAHLFKLIPGQPLVLVHGQALPLHLVLVATLELAPAQNLLHNLSSKQVFGLGFRSSLDWALLGCIEAQCVQGSLSLTVQGKHQ